MTARAKFTNDEWDHLVQLPRWIVAAASAAQHDLKYRTNIELEVGFIASARGRETGNAFVTEVAVDTMRVYDDRSTTTASAFGDRESAIAAVLDRVRVANQILATKADIADATAYRHWLIAMTDIVISATRTGDFLGFGGQRITQSEHHFRDSLVLALES